MRNNAISVPDGLYGAGERVDVTLSAGDTRSWIFYGYEDGTRNLIFDRRDESQQFTIFLVDDPAPGVTFTTYRPLGAVITDQPIGVGVYRFADWGRSTSGDPGAFTSQGQTIEFDRNIYEVGDTVALTIRGVNQQGQPTTSTRTSVFVGSDRNTGDPIFRPVNDDGSRIIAATDTQANYQVLAGDIVAEPWPREAVDATFSNYGFRRDLGGDFDLQGPGLFSGLDVPDGIYEIGDTLKIRAFGGTADGLSMEVTFVGYVSGPGSVEYPIFEAADFAGARAQFIGTGETDIGSYTPGSLVTDTPYATGVATFADYGLRRPQGDTDELTGQNRGVEFDQGVYNVNDIVQLRIGPRGADGGISGIEHTVNAEFAGLDRETGNPLFSNPKLPNGDDFGDGRQIIAASEERDVYDVPATDIIAKAWPAPDAAGAAFSNYGIRQGDLTGDFDLQGAGAIFGLHVPAGVHEIDDTLMIRPFGGVAGGEALEVTLVGHEESTGYPIFETADFNGQGRTQFIGTNEPHGTATYRLGNPVVDDEPFVIGEATFSNYALRIDTGIGDGRFRIQDDEIKFAQGVYDQQNNAVTLDFGIHGTQAATFLGYERDTGNLVFQTPSHVYVAFNDYAPLGATYTLGDLVTDMPYTTCFAPGTLIATPHGERAVETLKPGEEVLTANGDTVPVRFVGFQKVPTLFGPKEFTRPVRIRVGALGENTPHTDLVVTRDHGMIVDGVICHAGALINGTSIVEVPAAEFGKVATYYHVETEGHVPLLANGAVAESFIDEVDRASFANHGEFVAMYGSRVPDMTPMNLPRAMSARQVPPRIQTRLGLPEYDATVIIPVPAPSGVRRLWQELREWVARSAGYRRRAWLRG